MLIITWSGTYSPVWVTGVVIDNLLPLLDNLSCSAKVVVVVAVAGEARVGLIAHNLGHPSSIATIVAVAWWVARVAILLDPVFRGVAVTWTTNHLLLSLVVGGSIASKALGVCHCFVNFLDVCLATSCA